MVKNKHGMVIQGVRGHKVSGAKEEGAAGQVH